MLAAKKSVDLTVESNVEVVTSSEEVVHSTSESPPHTKIFSTAAESEGDVEEGCNLTCPTPTVHTYQNVYLHIDTYKIEQVIRNLITNAVRKRIFFLCLFIIWKI